MSRKNLLITIAAITLVIAIYSGILNNDYFYFVMGMGSVLFSGIYFGYQYNLGRYCSFLYETNNSKVLRSTGKIVAISDNIYYLVRIETGEEFKVYYQNAIILPNSYFKNKPKMINI